MFTAFLLLSGLFWTATYLLIIRRGIVDGVYGMPVAALCANLSWEILFTLIVPHDLPQVVVNAVWLTFDLIIAWQTLSYGPREWGLSRIWFSTVFAVTFSVAFLGVLLVTVEFADRDEWSGAYAAFGQNLMMSALFIELFRNRRGSRGQSIPIAMCKLFGTAFASVAFWIWTSLGESLLMQYLFVSILAFDTLYLALLVRNWRTTTGRRSPSIAAESLRDLSSVATHASA